MRVLYRASQFWNALQARPGPQDLARASQALSPELMALFLAMPASEQSHSLEIFDQLLEQGETDRDLLTAALLHDVGKNRCPLRPWERAVIVLGKALLPEKSRQWGQGQPGGWRRLFAVAEQHPAWGAEMAAQAGASPAAVSLIRRHQEVSSSPADTGQGDLLHRLQMLDNES